MPQHKTKILMTEFATHDVKRFVLEKPANYQFMPGQATEVSINLPDWKDKKHPFTFTSQNKDKILEFIIKGYPVKQYPEHSGMTETLHHLEPGHELLIEDPWGTINYEGPGVFIAGGAGVTPFIAILRHLKNQGQVKDNKLIFSNKTVKDIILEKEFKDMFRQEDLILTLTQEKKYGYSHQKIDQEFLEKQINNFDQNFYVCGPPAMVKDIKQALKNLGAKMQQIVFEE